MSYVVQKIQTRTLPYEGGFLKKVLFYYFAAEKSIT
jgi:hypothetical protein